MMYHYGAGCRLLYYYGRRGLLHYYGAWCGLLYYYGARCGLLYYYGAWCGLLYNYRARCGLLYHYGTGRRLLYHRGALCWLGLNCFHGLLSSFSHLHIFTRILSLVFHSFRYGFSVVPMVVFPCHHLCRHKHCAYKSCDNHHLFHNCKVLMVNVCRFLRWQRYKRKKPPATLIS
jgi:hypothetical protein